MVIARHKQITERVAARAGNNPIVSGHAMANGTMRVLRALWNDARENMPELPENPVRNFRRFWHRDKRRERYVRPSELPKFYQAAKAIPNAIHSNFILLLLFTGLRRGEAAALGWGEIDFQDRVIRLPASRTKASRSLDLPMSEFVYKLLQDCLNHRINDFVFPSTTSRSGHIEEPKGIFDDIAAASGVRVSCHDLRRTFTTVAESSEITLLALKGLINHSFGQDITATYVVSNVERLRKPMEQVTNHLIRLIGITNDAI